MIAATTTIAPTAINKALLFPFGLEGGAAEAEAVTEETAFEMFIFGAEAARLVFAI
jgi:hypothetical protein